ncbi:MAG: methyltransferase [Alphaproteobacteria bacterium]|nr:methyltransferase [Alphaproteobacteria bacterium]
MTAIVDGNLLDVVIAPVQFAPVSRVAQIVIVTQPGIDQPTPREAYVRHDVAIHNARPIADRLHLDREGFSFMRRETAVSDLYDDEAVRRTYYPEMEKLITEVTGASRVIVFDHTQRIDDAELRAKTKRRPPAGYVHNDFTATSAAQRVRDLLPRDEAEARLRKRYASINVWRPIKGPVRTAPLLICGYGDLADEDLITVERHYPDGRIGRIYNVAYNPSQRWYYFPDMERDEFVLLKCFDSLTDGTARWTAHGSFQPPGLPAGTPPRESIEIRTLLFFD